MENCAFCNRAAFEERIITETDEFFVIATLGQITDGGYVLIFPKEHYHCLSVIRKQAKFLNFLLFIKRTIALEYGIIPMLFEHGVVGQTVPHAHLHLVPSPVDLTTQVLSDFPKISHHSFKDLICWIPRQLTPTRLQPYLLWHPSTKMEIGLTHILINPQNVPAQYFRTILAEALGRPERANWRTMDAELDKKLWSETVERLKKYF